MLKKKELNKEEYITVLVEVTAMEGCIMKGDTSREPFSLPMAILGSKIRPTNVKKLAVTALQHILTPLFITFDIFALAVPYFFAEYFIFP